MENASEYTPKPAENAVDLPAVPASHAVLDNPKQPLPVSDSSDATLSPLQLDLTPNPIGNPNPNPNPEPSDQGPGTSSSEKPSAGIDETAEAEKPIPGIALFVGNLHPDLSEKELEEVFSKYAKAICVKICRAEETNISLGHGYVNYTTNDEAIATIEKMNKTFLYGKEIRVTFSCRDPEIRRESNVFTKNLVETINDKELMNLFGPFGNVLSCKVAVDPQGKSKGYGFIQYDSGESAKAAIQALNGSNIGGKEIYVGRFQKKNERILDPNASYTNLYLKNLSLDITEELLTLKFSEFGKITKSAIARDPQGNSKGFGFVNFEKPECAKKAQETMHGVLLGPERLYVARAQKKSERAEMLRRFFEEMKSDHKKSNLYVKNLSDDVNEQTLKNLFSPYGVITSVKIMRAENGFSRGFGFVCFRHSDEASKAVNAIHGKKFHGKPLVVCFHQAKENRKMYLQNSVRNMNIINPMDPNYYPPHTVYYAAPPPLHLPYVGSLPHPTMVAPPVYPKPLSAPHPYRMGPPFPMKPAFQPLPSTAYVSYQYPRPQHHRQNRSCGGNGGRRNHCNSNQRRQHQGERHGAAKVDYRALKKLVESVGPEEQKTLVGEWLFPLIVDQLSNNQTNQTTLAAKITGMLLDLENERLLALIDSKDLMAVKVKESLEVLKMAQLTLRDNVEDVAALSSTN